MQILKIFLVLGILVCSLYGQSQIKFFNTYTNNGHDFGEGITQLSDSSYIITGSSSSFDEAPAQAFLLHVDSMGQYLWSRAYGGSESDWGRRVFAVEGDGIYVAGYTNSMGNGSFDFYFFKTDMTGNLLFEKTYGGQRFEKLNSAVMLKDTSFILVGQTTSNTAEVEDMYIIRVKSNGDTLWTKRIGGSGADIARSVAVMNDTTVVIAGDYFVEDSLLTKSVLIRMHIDGTVQWEKFYGENGTYSVNDVTINNGIIRAVGYHKIAQLPGQSFLFCLLTYEDGSLIFELIDSSPGSSKLDYITAYGTEGKFYVADQVAAADLSLYPDGEDCFIYRYSSYLFWDDAFVSPSNIGQDQANQLIATSDGGAIMVGYNSRLGAGGNNVMLLKIGPNDDFPESNSLPIENNLVFIEELKADFPLAAFPNPVKDILKLESTIPGSKQIQVVDAFGKVLQESVFDLSTEIDFQAYSSGMYFIKVQAGGKQHTSRIVKY